MNKKQQQNTGKLKIIPLGGLEQIGMNITAFEYEDSIVVVDCGLSSAFVQCGHVLSLGIQKTPQGNPHDVLLFSSV